jgi:uncharacterized lipoprotein YbaY
MRRTALHHRRIAGSLAAAGLALAAAACGQDAEATNTLGASDSDLVPADAGDSGGDAIGPTTVSVLIELPADETLAGMVIVALEDVSFADVPSAELGRVEMPVSDLRDQGSKVDFFLPIPLEESADVNASVHVDVDGDGQLSEGDWTSPEIVPVSSFGGSTVAVSLIEI